MKNKIQQIILDSFNEFKGTNEAILHASEEIEEYIEGVVMSEYYATETLNAIVIGNLEKQIEELKSQIITNSRL